MGMVVPLHFLEDCVMIDRIRTISIILPVLFLTLVIKFILEFTLLKSFLLPDFRVGLYDRNKIGPREEIYILSSAANYLWFLILIYPIEIITYSLLL